MAPVRTAEDLTATLDRQLKNRTRELNALRGLITRRGTATPLREAAMRGGVTVLYGHWQGLVKASAAAYLDYVRVRNVPYDALTTNFRVLAIRDILKRNPQRPPEEQAQVLVEFLQGSLGEPYDLPGAEGITAANLNSQVLRAIVLTLGLDFAIFEERTEWLDRFVLARHKIAHGDYDAFSNHGIDEKRYVSYHDTVVGLMVDFQNEISMAVSDDRYRAVTAST